MRKFLFLVTLGLLSANLFGTQTWDILDKSMAAWNTNGGNVNDKAWSTSQAGSGIKVTQETGYVNVTKTSALASNNYAFLIPQAFTLSTDTPYSIAIKARCQPIDKTLYPDASGGFESNQISARLNNKNIAIHLKYGDDNTGFLTVSPGLEPKDEDKYKINTSEWHVYRIVFHADNSIYDVYVDDIKEPIFENVATTAMTGTNILRLGAESTHRCNMDIEYAKMGTGDFYSRAKIVSAALSVISQAEEKSNTISVTAKTIAMDDNQKLLISLVDGEDQTIVNAIEAVVAENKVEANFTIPSGLAKGKYFVKVAAPDGKIGDVNVTPQLAEYMITSSAFEGKNLATFGNSITAAANSWAYQTEEKLRFANLYNGAIAGACWYRRARLAQDGDSIWTQDYTDPNFAGFGNGTNSTREQFQKIINNCAVIHIQKYLIERTTVPDYIILSYGTNDVDGDYTMGDPTVVMNEPDLNKVNLYTMSGAVRWSIETLQKEFPAAKIYVALPIQARDASKNNGNKRKIARIQKVCDAMSVPYFDCYNESGITQANEGTYLRDGLHPNAAGQTVHGDYIIKKLEEAILSSSIDEESVDETNISISSSVLSAGETFSVKYQTTDSSLSEVKFYGLAGNAVYHKSISGSESTLEAPNASGVYVMPVMLKNNASKTFKILVK